MVDGIVLEAGRLWAVQSFSTLTTAARSGSRLAVLNAKFDTGFPPTADHLDVVVLDA
jgi:hypothetical protein